MKMSVTLTIIWTSALVTTRPTTEMRTGFNIQDLFGCVEIDDGLYVGPYCSEDKYSIYLGVYIRLQLRNRQCRVL